MESEIITTQDLFVLELDASTAGGRLQPTGLRPQFSDKFAKAGLTMPASLFSGRIG
jgi:pilus assembly protein CpaF